MFFLTNIAQSVSGESIGVDIPLMEAGFDSLALVELVVRIQEDIIIPAGIQQEVTTRDIFELVYNATLRAIAQRLIKSSEDSKRGILDSTKNIETWSKEGSSGQVDILGMDCKFPGGGYSLLGKASPGVTITPRSIEMRLQAPASFQQITMYTGDHLAASQAHSDYNLVIQFGAIGKLDVGALKMALAFLWRRHQVLRTTLIFQVPQFPGLFLYGCN
ncbi:MAG: acyl carrier protein [Gammaproteobacteria bacterium]|nr:acyl carrier protein [Gammaproteobacteria bacterium]